MGIYYVGSVGFGSYEEAQKYARDRGMLDALGGQNKVDVIDRESGVFVARNIPEHEAEAISRGSPSYTRAPAGQYTEESIKGLSYSPDRQAKPQSQSQVVVDVETGKNVPFGESKQAQIEENIARARIEKPNWAM